LGYNLAVVGSILAEGVTVKLQSSGWPDFVFENTYILPTLKEVEQHIKDNGYLIDMPSSKDVETNGINLGEMNIKLLQKIEELTLYVIQQQKDIDTLIYNNKQIIEENKKIKSILKRLDN
jgi:hypothetical protein